MEFKEREFIPVLLGGDINTYSMARAFYEQYRVKSHVFGKYAAGPSYKSRITEYHPGEAIDTDDYFLKTINGFAEKNADKKILLIGCGDSYVALIGKHRNELAENIEAPYIDYELMNRLQQKELFYQLCEKYGLDYPKTLVYDRSMGLDFNMEFQYPVIIKPSDSIQYWEHPFPGQNKVFTAAGREEMEGIIKAVYEAGYEDKLIIQDMIPGNDEYMRVLTAYSDRNGKVKMMCLGHVLLEEHTPHGKGNHAVIITESNEVLMMRVKNLLEDMKYVGFSNFDIKFDRRDNKYKFFEINIRQGRSNYYVTGSGCNIARYVAEEYIYGRDIENNMVKREHLWMVVPKAVAFRYVKEEENKAEMRRLIKEKKMVNPVFMRGDLTPGRFLAMAKTHFSHYVKFKKYYSQDNGEMKDE